MKKMNREAILMLTFSIFCFARSPAPLILHWPIGLSTMLIIVLFANHLRKRYQRALKL
ncbi:hypothetical protein QBC46DRAFT_394778 [Diplogelasinospora grovesii]|uniref:Uncharacterized protein n=1 Tax=Diplogelasinospora grovesii TaxID=303347 RepID=A0AAN6MZR7_9PEZI|nr:hypothetical protein QBC46DRAFT_394778 [Diplogelasinospora grovesii]